jgi:DNA helicase-2/ATP-dependent DNA helicase PcrA
MKWSSEQNAIFTHFGNKDAGNLVIKARAGTGKTTTVKHAFSFAPETKILYAVFNKKNQKEAAEKIQDKRVDVRTLHSLGYWYIKRIWKNAKPDENVEYDRIGGLIGSGVSKEVIGLLVGLLGKVKNVTVTDPTYEEIDTIAGEYDLDFEGTDFQDSFPNVIIDALNLSKEPDPEGRISFDDMVWLPVAIDLVTPRYDLVCIDEAQDMNAPQLLMARTASTGRVIVVGDDRQAIYGFRGAVQNSMNRMQDSLKAKSLGLTTTYRCPKAVVNLVNDVVLDFQAAPTAPAGLVSVCGSGKILESAKPGDAVLSRLNAPLMPLALKLLRKHIPARIEGRDVGQQLISMVRSFKAFSIDDFEEKIEAWRKKQIDRLSKRHNAEKKIEQTNDIAETLLALAEGCDLMDAVEGKLNALFQDTDSRSRPAVILSSVHKAKGLEWARVFLLSETFRKGSSTEEDNIWYVAATRAMKELWMVTDAAIPPSLPSLPALAANGSDNGEEAYIARLQPGFRSEETLEKVEAKVRDSKPPPRRLAPPARPKYSGPPLRPGWILFEGIPLSPDMVKAREKAQRNRPDPFTIPPGMKFFRRGDVINRNGGEWYCDSVSNCNARFVNLTGRTEIIKFTSGEGESAEKIITRGRGEKLDLSNSYEPGQVIRSMTEEEIKIFLARGNTRQAGEKKQIQGNGDSETKSSNEMKNKTNATKATKVDRNITGSSQFVRDCVAKGMTKEATHAATIKRWPIFESSDKEGFESRWRTGVKIKASSDKKAKAAEKAAASGKSGKAPAKPAGKASTKPKGKSGKKAGKSGPPARNASPAVVAQPAGGPPPRASLPPASTPEPEASPAAS